MVPIRHRHRVRVHPELRLLCYAARADGLHLGTLSALAGWTRQSEITHQLQQPFVQTRLNTKRWRVVAQLVNFNREPLEPVR